MLQNKLIKNTKICFVSAGVACLHVDKRFARLSPSDLLVESKIKFTIMILWVVKATNHLKQV